jgi:hypothetical protein
VDLVADDIHVSDDQPTDPDGPARQRPERNEIAVVPLTSGVQLHQEDVAKRGTKNQQSRVIKENVAVNFVERLRLEEDRAVVQPLRRHAVRPAAAVPRQPR